MRVRSSGVVVDSYALLSFLFGQPDRQKLTQWLRAAGRGAARILLGRVNWVEVGYRIEQEQGTEARDEALARIDRLPLQLVELNPRVAFRAMELKARYPIALGDAFAAALAKELGLPVLTGDPEFKLLAKEIDVDWMR